MGIASVASGCVPVGPVTVMLPASRPTIVGIVPIEIVVEEVLTAQLPSEVIPLLVVAALWELGLVAGVDEGEEVGAVVSEGAERQLEFGDKPLRQFAFGGDDLRFLDQVEVVPEGLARELVAGGGDEPRERGVAIPVGKAEFAGGTDRPVDRSQKQILAHGKALSAFGEMAIEEFDKPDLLGKIVECDDIAESSDIDRSRLRGLALFTREGGVDEVVRGAQIGGAHDLGLAPDALAFAGVVVGVAVDDLGREACHKAPSLSRVRSYPSEGRVSRRADEY